jgi:hypothetical protein
LATNDPNAFTAASMEIIEEANVGNTHRRLAFVVWEGRSRGEDDETAEFLRIALSKGFKKRSVLTKQR